MPKAEISGIGSFRVDLETLVEIENNGVIDEMLIAGGKVMEKAQKRTIVKRKLVDTGQLRDSITMGKTKKTNDGKVLYVYPRGERTRKYKTDKEEDKTKKRYKKEHKKGQTYKVRNAEIAFVAEFGVPHRGIRAQPFMQDAINESGEDAFSAETAVFDKWLERTLK